MSSQQKNKCRLCGEEIPWNRKFCNAAHRSAWEQQEVDTTCVACGATYKIKNKTIQNRASSGRASLCESCRGKRGGRSVYSLPSGYLRKCHTCDNLTTQYWCSECTAKRLEITDCGNAPFADYTGVEVAL